MVSATRYHLPSILLLIVGIGVIAQGVLVVPHPGQPEYHHSVDSISSSDIPEEATVIEYTAFSTNGQEAIRDALNSPDGTATVYGEANRPSDFRYSDDLGIYYFTYQGDYYELTTSGGPSSLDVLDFVLLGAYVVAGAAAIVIASWSFTRSRPRLPLALLVAGVCLQATLVSGLYQTGSNTQLQVGAGLLIVFVPLIIVWHLLGRQHTDGQT